MNGSVNFYSLELKQIEGLHMKIEAPVRGAMIRPAQILVASAVDLWPAYPRATRPPDDFVAAAAR